MSVRRGQVCQDSTAWRKGPSKEEGQEVVKIVSARVHNYYVILKLSDGSTVLRDFSLCRGSLFKSIHRQDGRGLVSGVRIHGGMLSWPNEIDFELDLILWGWPRGKRRHPIKRAVVGAQGTLIPAPLARSL